MTIQNIPNLTTGHPQDPKSGPTLTKPQHVTGPGMPRQKVASDMLVAKYPIHTNIGK